MKKINKRNNNSTNALLSYESAHKRVLVVIFN